MDTNKVQFAYSPNTQDLFLVDMLTDMLSRFNLISRGRIIWFADTHWNNLKNNKMSDRKHVVRALVNE